MKYDRFIKAAVASLTLAFVAAPTFAPAETLRVMRGAPSSALNVPMNRAVVVESDTPFTELSIANPGIADISSLSDRTIYVLGKEPGRTTLTLLGADGRLITNVEVHVTPDIAEFKERLEQILPGEPIEVRTANNGIVLSGTVSSTARLDRALELAERYAPDRVSNLDDRWRHAAGYVESAFCRDAAQRVSKALSSSSMALQRFCDIGGGDGFNFWEVVQHLGHRGSGCAISAALNGGCSSGIKLKPTVPSSSDFNAQVDLRLASCLKPWKQGASCALWLNRTLTALSGTRSHVPGWWRVSQSLSNKPTDGTISVEFKPFGVELSFVATCC